MVHLHIEYEMAHMPHNRACFDHDNATAVESQGQHTSFALPSGHHCC